MSRCHPRLSARALRPQDAAPGRTPADIGSGNTWVFDQPFFIMLNFAVGGTWPGNPDGTTPFPQTMTVDYVRVCQR